MKRTLAIGDIHGGFKALKQVLQRAKVTENDKLIFLGDYVDGWSESSQIIDFLIKLSQKQECIFIKGNHDAWAENWLLFGSEPPVWLANGGQTTVDSYSEYSLEELNVHLEFFQNMKNYYVDEENRLFIHAGYTSTDGPDVEMYTADSRWDRTLWETAVAMDKKLSENPDLYPKKLLLFKEIFIGHTHTLHLGITEPLRKSNVWNLDTGAAFTGALSIMDVDTKEFRQSDTLPHLYPEEKGRNHYKVKLKI